MDKTFNAITAGGDMSNYEFISRYTKAETISDYIKCYIAKALRAKVVTPLGRVKLLPNDYYALADRFGVAVLD